MNLLKPLRTNTKIEDMDLSGYDFDATELNALTKKLEHNFIRSLDLSNNSFSGKSLNLILKALQKNKNLEILDLSENGLTGKGMKEFPMILKKHKSLTTLDLSHNEIHDQGLGFILEGLDQNIYLENLYISNCGITDAGAELLSKYLSNKIQKLTRLDISINTGIIKSGMNIIFGSLKTNSMLKVLKVSEISINLCTAELLDMLKINDTLVQLTANRCGLSSKDLYDIIKSQENKTNLKILHLEGNATCVELDEESIDFSNIIGNNICLRVLNLKGCFEYFESSSINSVCKGLEGNHTLEMLSIGSNQRLFRFDIESSLIENSHLKSLTLSRLWLAEDFASVIENNQTLEVIDISTCFLSHTCMKSILGSLEKNQTLLELVLPFGITKVMILIFMQSMRVNNTLESLKIVSFGHILGEEYSDKEVEFIFYSLLMNRGLEEFSYHFPKFNAKPHFLNNMKDWILKQNVVCKEISKIFCGMNKVKQNGTLNDITFSFVYMGQKRSIENVDE